GTARRARLRDPRRRQGSGTRRAPPPGERRARARAGRCHARRGPQGDPRQDGSAHDVILGTPRALWLGAGLALLGLAGLWLPWGLEAMLVGDLALVAAVWVDGLLAPRSGPSPRHLVAVRDAPPAFSVGRQGEVTYRWRNGAPRAARLRLREVRPDLLGGAQPPRWIRVAARGVGWARVACSSPCGIGCRATTSGTSTGRPRADAARSSPGSSRRSAASTCCWCSTWAGFSRPRSPASRDSSTSCGRHSSWRIPPSSTTTTSASWRSPTGCSTSWRRSAGGWR